MNIKNFPQLCLCVSPWNRGHCIETCHKTRGQLAGQIVQKCDKDELKHKNEKKETYIDPLLLRFIELF